jgi:ABC-type transport system involved in cytochrome c biogenesis permease subunit
LKALISLLLFCSFYSFAEDSGALFRAIPLQDSGRIKPMGTFADFTLLKFNGKRSLTLGSGEKVDSINWFMTVMFQPEKADLFKHFAIDDANALTIIGVPTSMISSKRMRFSFSELEPYLNSLKSQVDTKIRPLAVEKRSISDQALLNLSLNLNHYKELRSVMDFAALAQNMPPEIVQFVPDKKISSLLADLGKVRSGLKGVYKSPNFDYKRVEKFFEKLRILTSPLNIIIPSHKQNEWITVDDVIVKKLLDYKNEFNLSKEINLISLWEDAYIARGAENFHAAIKALSIGTAKAAGQRGEYDKIPTEVNFYKVDYFTKSLILFILGFILVAFSWLKSDSKIGLNLCRASFVSVCFAIILLVIGITLRCIIRSRPPVSTLYETILFISAVACLVATLIAVLRHSSVMLGVSTIIGCLGMFLSIKYEMKEAVDTMPQLQAVLDTNFWLSTHVTSVTMGYAAGLLAGIISHFYLVLKFLDFKGYRSFKDGEAGELTRYVYGILCFGLIFSFIGTILGGIWANYSWGRFWGWDPKENGAMLIVLWLIFTLHAKKGGYVKQYGLHILSVLSVIVISFSWWGVNLLGIGLHSYGFTKGISQVLNTLYIFELLVAVLGFVLWRSIRKKKLSSF